MDDNLSHAGWNVETKANHVVCNCRPSEFELLSWQERCGYQHICTPILLLSMYNSNYHANIFLPQLSSSEDHH